MFKVQSISENGESSTLNISLEVPQTGLNQDGIEHIFNQSYPAFEALIKCNTTRFNLPESALGGLYIEQLLEGELWSFGMMYLISERVLQHVGE